MDESSIAGIGDARVVRRGDFLGVVASHEYDAIQAAARLKVVYADPPTISGSGNLFAEMRALDAAGLAPARFQVLAGDVDAALAGAARTVAQSYAYHYQGHMPIGPSCAVADVTPSGRDRARQHAGRLRDAEQPRAAPRAAASSQIRVQYWEGASSFGNSPARFDTGEAAAVMSQLAGAPVRLQFMRWDEHGWDNYGPAVLSDMRGGIDTAGNIVGARLHGLRHPVALDALRRHDAERRVPARAAGARLGRRDQLRQPVRDREPAGDGEVAAALGHLLQDLRAAGAALPADLLRLRAARRRARARGGAGSLRVQAPEHPDRAGERRFRSVGATC